MVRLLQWMLISDGRTGLGFQSHNGAIAARPPLHFPQRIHAFNPTMVRLLPEVGADVVTVRYSFQSHNGAIAA